MSAIAGIIHPSGEPVDGADLESVSAVLEPYGPESESFWIEGSAGMVFRLMSFTPEDRFERQPLVGAGGRYVLMVDGRIDNRPELAERLGIASSTAKELPDSLFILRAWEKWGEASLSHLVGSFNLALWEPRERRLHLAASPFQGRPLFYYHTPRRFAFASMPKGLLVLPGIPRKMNEDKLADFLVFNHWESHTTFYEGIFRLPLGHMLTVHNGKVSVRRYWQTDLQHTIRYPRDEDYVEAFLELFDHAVKDTLRSLHPVGIMMSGGLDSSSVAVTAAPQLRDMDRRLTAFTEVPRADFEGVVPRGRYADETPFVRAIARLHDNMDLRLVRTESDTILTDLSPIFYHLEAPVRNAPNWVWMDAIFREARSRGVRMLLTGGQGNLTISWDGSGLLPGWIQRGAWLRAWREVRAMVRRGTTRWALRAFLGRGLLPLLPRPFRMLVDFSRNRTPLLGSPWRVYSVIHPHFAAERKIVERARAVGHDVRFLYEADYRRLRYRTLTGLDQAADYGHAFLGLYGADVRSPTNDVRVAEFCLALPEEQFLRDGEEKWLIRRAMVDRLPQEVLYNPHRGLQAADASEKMFAARRRFLGEIHRLEQCEPARRALDLHRMRRMIENWTEDDSGSALKIQGESLLIQRGIMVGRFIEWFQAGGSVPG